MAVDESGADQVILFGTVDSSKRFYHFGPNVFDSLRGLLWRDGVEVRLTPRVSAILNLLIQRRGELVTKDHFIQEVWGGAAVEESNLARQISTLRRLLHETPEQREYIVTVPGIGYRFVGELLPLDDLPEALRPAPGGSPLSTAARHHDSGVPPQAGSRLLPPDARTLAAASPTQRPSSRRFTLMLTVGLVGAACFTALLVLAWPDQQTNAATVSPRLWRFSHDGSSQADPAWSPDGRQIALTSDRDGNSDIWLYGITDSTARQLTSSPARDSQPDWSPDGRWIVFRSDRDGGGIYLLAVEDGTELRLTTFGSRPKWSPTRDLILFTHTDPHAALAVKLYVVPPASGATPSLVDHAALAGLRITSAAWTPDGRVSVWATDQERRRQFLTVPVDGGQVVRSDLPRELASADEAPVLTTFVWAPSSRFLYFEGLSNGVRNIWRVAVAPDTLRWLGGPERLTVGPGADIGISVSPAGSKIAFGVNTTSSTLWSFAFDPDSGRIEGSGHKMVSGDVGTRGVAISRDGHHVAYRLDRGNQREIWMRTSGMPPRLLVAESDWTLSAPRWSPDLSRLAYQRRPISEAAQGGASIVLLDVNRRASREIELPPKSSVLPTDWAPDGKSLLATCRLTETDNLGTCVLPIIDAELATAEPALSRIAVDERLSLYQQRFSPDQRWISFIAVPAGAPHIATVHVMPSAGGRWVAISDGHSYDDKPRWSPDGRVIYFISNRDGHLEVWGRQFDAEAGAPIGEPFRVTSLDNSEQVLSPYLGELDMYIMPSRIILPMYESSSRVWILDHADR